jgi:hypothetical protein
MTAAAITPCPGCGVESSENYGGTGTCWQCSVARQDVENISRDPAIVHRAGLRVRGADLDRARPTRWAWQHRIALGYLNLLAGNEGSGKGTLIAKLIALLSRGDLPGELHGQPVGVGVLGDEDSFDDVWTPRLHAAGADLSLVVQIDRPDGGFVDLRTDHDKLLRTAKEHELRVLFFDQLLDNLGTGTDDWRQKPVREALQPLRALARELDVAALGCLHPNKRGTTFRDLMSGTVAFNSVSRCSQLLGQHPDDKEVRVLVRGKGNYSKAPEALEFEIASHTFEANGYTFDVPLASDFTVSNDLTVEDLLGKDAASKQFSGVAEACDIIETLLPHDGDWHPAKPILEACIRNDINERTAQRAKVKLGLVHTREKAFQAPVLWRWPDAEDAPDDTIHDVHPSCISTVASVASVASTNGQKPLRKSSDDIPDTDDSDNTRRQCVLSGGIAEDDDLERWQAILDEGPDGWREQPRTSSGEAA